MISINTQKKIMWIPLVNFVNILMFPFNLRGIRIGSRAWWMAFAYFFGFGLGFFSLSVLLEPILLPASVITTVYADYLFPLVMSYGLIHYQKKYLKF